MREIRIADLDKRISSFLASVKRGCSACVDLLVLNRSGPRRRLRVIPSWIGENENTIPGGTDAEETIEGPFQSDRCRRDLIRFTVPVPDPDSREAMTRAACGTLRLGTGNGRHGATAREAWCL